MHTARIYIGARTRTGQCYLVEASHTEPPSRLIPWPSSAAGPVHRAMRAIGHHSLLWLTIVKVKSLGLHRTQVQCTGSVPTMSVEKCDGFKLFVPEATAANADFQIVTAMTSELNIVVVPASQVRKLLRAVARWCLQLLFDRVDPGAYPGANFV